jgi:hypothetical protein
MRRLGGQIVSCHPAVSNKTAGGASTNPRRAWQVGLKSGCRCLSKRFFACEERDDCRIPRRAELEQRRSLTTWDWSLDGRSSPRTAAKQKKLRAVVYQMARRRNRAERGQFGKHVVCCGTWCKAPSSFEVFLNPTTKEEPRMLSAMLLRT